MSPKGVSTTVRRGSCAAPCALLPYDYSVTSTLIPGVLNPLLSAYHKGPCTNDVSREGGRAISEQRKEGRLHEFGTDKWEGGKKSWKCVWRHLWTTRNNLARLISVPGAEFSDGFIGKISWFSLKNPSENSAPDQYIQGSANPQTPGSENKRIKICVLLPAAGRRTQLFHLTFTEPGFAVPCTQGT